LHNSANKLTNADESITSLVEIIGVEAQGDRKPLLSLFYRGDKSF